uniref:Phosphatidylcholine synthase n=1 Tax=Rhodopseudomonas palustris (strain BisA53) TaxID=316055 RepID=Q07MU9_RHOP5
MTPLEPSEPPTASRTLRAAALGVHWFTALGAGLALVALLEAVRAHWAGMFFWLGLALLIDGLDGPLARKLKVKELQPNWSGEVLDLVVDFVTYVFVPAFAIIASGLLLPLIGPLLGIGIVMSGAMYFADQRMKSDDNHFRGFPALWNAAAFYLFLLQPQPVLGSLLIAGLIVLTFVPFHTIHPVRVARLRWLNLALMALWAGLALWTLKQDFDVGLAVQIALCAIALYILFGDALIRLTRLFRK